MARIRITVIGLCGLRGVSCSFVEFEKDQYPIRLCGMHHQAIRMQADDFWGLSSSSFGSLGYDAAACLAFRAQPARMDAGSGIFETESLGQ